MAIKKTKNPAPVKPRAKDANKYAKDIKEKVLDNLFRDMIERLKGAATFQNTWKSEIERALIDVQNALGDQAKEIAEKNLLEIQGYHKAKMNTSFRSALGLAYNPFVADFGIKPLMQSALAENISLIKSIPQQLNSQIFDGFNKILSDEGFNQLKIIEMLESKFKVSNRRAKFIARDQNNKIIGNLTKQRQTDIGIEKYTWRTAGDERVRDEPGDNHEIMNFRICRWDNPKVYFDEKSNTWQLRSSIGAVELHPGEDFNCRCVAMAIIE